MSKSSPRKNGVSDEPGPSHHEKKPKNAKDYNIGKGAKKRMNKAKNTALAAVKGNEKARLISRAFCLLGPSIVGNVYV